MEFSTLNGYKVKDKKAIRYYDTVALMKADTTLKEGMHVKTKGYYSANDGGNGEYIIVNNNELVADNGLIHTLTNGLKARLIVSDSIIIEQFGAYGDSTHDDRTPIINAINTGYKIKFGKNKTYYISSYLTITDDNIEIIGNNATLKFNGFSDSSVGNIGYLYFNGSDNVTIRDLIIDGDITWGERPYSWESGHSSYETNRNKTYDGICFNNCNDIYVENCQSIKCKVGFHFLYSKNATLINCKSLNTMADGVLIHDGSEDVHIYSHYCKNVNDDQFSMVHETNNTDYVKRCSFNNCTAEDSFNACVVMQECVDCYASNCTSINNKGTPIKFGTSLGTFGCKNCTMDSINVTSSNTLQGTNTSLATAQANGTIVLGSTSGNSPMVNCKVLNSNFIETSGNNLSLFNPNVSGLEFYNTLFDGINLIYTDVNGSKFENCTIKSKDTNVFTRCSFTFRNSSITNDLTYSARGTNTLQCNGCNNVILDDVNVSGTSTEYGNCIEFYAASSDTQNVYLNTNDKKTRLVNESDIHNNGVIILTDIDRYSYARFREGQLVYFLSNHKLYVVGTSDWAMLNS